MAGIEGSPQTLPSVICPLTANPAPGACTGMVNVPLAWVRDASVTDTEKEAVPVAVGLPETVPLEKLSPTAERLGAPDVGSRMSPEPEPPVAARV